uniref:Uncharacterized protein n=1 Tax=viral metagenome TaxID=1070528 RepID=A0A6C0DIA0_9ZZZZ
MDTNQSNDLTASIMKTLSQSNDTGVDSSLSDNTTSYNLFDYFKSFSLFTWFLIIIILALLGLNIFVYLAKGTQGASNLLKEVLKYFGLVSSEVVSNTAVGTKTLVDTTTDAVIRGSNSVKGSLTNSGTPIQHSIPQQHNADNDLMRNKTLNTMLNKSNVVENNSKEYQADDTTSNIQKGPSKSGYCYIGEDRGFRSCVYVNESDQCMSGDIFPTNEICVNPSLRV